MFAFKFKHEKYLELPSYTVDVLVLVAPLNKLVAAEFHSKPDSYYQSNWMVKFDDAHCHELNQTMVKFHRCRVADLGNHWNDYRRPVLDSDFDRIVDFELRLKQQLLEHLDNKFDFTSYRNSFVAVGIQHCLDLFHWNFSCNRWRLCWIVACTACFHHLRSHKKNIIQSLLSSCFSCLLQVSCFINLRNSIPVILSIHVYAGFHSNCFLV